MLCWFCSIAMASQQPLPKPMTIYIVISFNYTIFFLFSSFVILQMKYFCPMVHLLKMAHCVAWRETDASSIWANDSGLGAKCVGTQTKELPNQGNSCVYVCAFASQQYVGRHVTSVLSSEHISPSYIEVATARKRRKKETKQKKHSFIDVWGLQHDGRL